MTGGVVWHHGAVTGESRARITGGPGCTIWLTGLSGSGKSTIAHAVEERLVAASRAAYVLDGDNVRHGLNGDLGFSPAARSENVRRIGEVARLMADAGLVVLAPVISPFRADRQRVREMHIVAELAFHEVHVATPIEVCEERDVKGMYAKARAGEISGFTGVDDPYEAPLEPELAVDTSTVSLRDCVDAVLRLAVRSV